MIFDILVLIVLVFSSIIGFLRGIIREVLTIVGLIAGAGAAVFVGPQLSPITHHWLKADPGMPPHKYLDVIPAGILADALAYGGVFIFVVLVLAIISHLLSDVIKALGLGPIDRLLGVLFGFGRGLLLLALLYLPVVLWTKEETRNNWVWLQTSNTRFYIESISQWMESYLPESLRNPQDKPGASPVREKLQELDLLHKVTNFKPADSSQDGKELPGVEPPPTPTPPQPGTGYENGQRRDMNDLIDKGLNNNADEKH